MVENKTLSKAEENYLKAIYKLAERNSGPIHTNAIASEMHTAPASVTDMLKKLSSKGLIHHEKYRGALLEKEGRKVATLLVRRHRLWESFLVTKLGFGWDEVHHLAEELEHIDSEELTDRLESFLGCPKFDPHGDPIPDKNGRFTLRIQQLLSELLPGDRAVVLGVQNHSKPFLNVLKELGISIGTEILVEDRLDFDLSMKIKLDLTSPLISHHISSQLYVRKTS